jgi:hypothetical protein
MTQLDRTALIELLDRLGADDDTAVLQAARSLHRVAAESGLSWDELITLDDAGADAADSDADAATVVASPDAAETLRLIDRILRKDVSDTLREDLTEMKRQLAEGSLDKDDRRYIRALAKRLNI